MRNFTVTLMLLVLFLSITFAIFQPAPSQKEDNTPVKKEKSHIEKLLTEPALKKEVIEEADKFVEKAKTVKEEAEIQEKEEIAVQQPEKSEEEQHLEKQTERAQNNYQMVDELMNKYNNDPSAQVSAEDFNKYVNQMLQQQR